MPRPKENPEPSGDLHIHFDRASVRPTRVIVELTREPGPTKLIALQEDDEQFNTLKESAKRAAAKLIEYGIPLSRKPEDLPPDLTDALDKVIADACTYTGGRSSHEPIDMLTLAIDKVFSERDFVRWQNDKASVLGRIGVEIEDALHRQ